MKITVTLLALLGLSLFAHATEPPHDLSLDLGNGVSLKLVLIPAGKFTMGSPDTEPHRQPNEGPAHEVTISKPFYLSIYTVTQEQFDAIMGTAADKSRWKGATLPVEPMSYDDITNFCQKLSDKIGKKVRITTEAEWEYACRAGTTTTWFWGNEETSAGDYDWFREKTESMNNYVPRPVGQKKPNPWGLYDVYGNVTQVCSDWGAHYPKATEADYTAAPVTDPTGPVTGDQHVARGQASWVGNARSAGYRYAYAHPDGGDHRFGFRVVVENSTAQ